MIKINKLRLRNLDNLAKLFLILNLLPEDDIF